MGYLESELVQHGAGGTPILLKCCQYGAHSAAMTRTYPVVAETDYRNDDGTGAVTTSYSYVFYSDSMQRGWGLGIQCDACQPRGLFTALPVYR